MACKLPGSKEHDRSMPQLEHVTQSDWLSLCMPGHSPIRCTLPSCVRLLARCRP